MSRYPKMTDRWIDVRHAMCDIREEINRQLSRLPVVTVKVHNRFIHLTEGMYAVRASNRVINIHDIMTGRKLYRLYRPQLVTRYDAQSERRRILPSDGEVIRITAQVAMSIYFNQHMSWRVGDKNCGPRPLCKSATVVRVAQSQYTYMGCQQGTLDLNFGDTFVAVYGPSHIFQVI